jgi:hypothetical protein
VFFRVFLQFLLFLRFLFFLKKQKGKKTENENFLNLINHFYKEKNINFNFQHKNLSAKKPAAVYS